ncbi:acyl-CoA dehydrogenase family protein [Actinophytocola gossypii]|uniref:Acyl-CoA/acyl-ACP dehydrogenase n=1 Tax=Actinophytocola gossypii TaxID=2812003 RepID=A0ABT2J1S7_9PSEU|nr:acyl-CoA dehydrogenase family protein [Actinophytocola gossypii]MCT2581813.1 acyl-CoA/acyl-ACP dehydrogenase [Actinophytocola gossypii]
MTVSFLLSPEQEQLKAAARGFARERLRDLAAATRAERDPRTRALLSRPVFENAVAAGFLKGLIPVPFGGNAAGGVDAAILIEEWAAESPDFVISMAGPLIALAPVYQVGTPAQVKRFVRPFLVDSGAPLAAMAFSEPDGSANFDAEGRCQGIRTTAVPDGDEWVVNGRKAWASHLCGWDGDGPDVMTIVCRTPGGVSLVVAEREHLAGRIEVEEYYDLPGLKGCLTTRVRLTDVRVPLGNLLGEEGQGVDLTRDAFLPSGASIGVFATAAMRQAFDVAHRFASTERRGGPVPIIEYQAVSDVLADAKGKIEAVRLLAWRALDAVLSGHPSGPELALHAKVFGSETGVAVVNDLVKVIGVTAYDEGFPIVRHLMDALSYPVIEGSNVGVRRRQLQTLFRTPGYDPLAASGMA